MKKLLIVLLILIPLFIFLYQATTLSLEDFPKRKIKLDDQELKVAVANNRNLQRQGLRNVKKLKGIDGMLFVYSKPVQHNFTMKDTFIPLRIGFFSAEGELVDKKIMEPCSENCKNYKSKEKFQYALELPQQSEISFSSSSKLLFTHSFQSCK